jgi:peptidoglycan hydrolase-like protein with peptidoglycan-binding domain
MVSAVQSDLAGEGYYRGVIDGVYGPQTRVAITRHQSNHGLQVPDVALTSSREHHTVYPACSIMLLRARVTIRSNTTAFGSRTQSLDR